jgi:hypothetical protein
MDDKGYQLAKRIIKRAAESYNPFEKVRVRGPLDGIVSFSDGSLYKFSDGISMIHRKNLPEAYNLGCRRLGNGPRSHQEP